MKPFKKIGIAFLIIAVLINYTSKSVAQIPNAKGGWQWVNGISSSGNTTTRIMKMDGHGNTYVCGYCYDHAHIKGQGQHANRTVVNDHLQTGTQLGFVAKYNCDGQLQWFKEIGDTIYGAVTSDMAVDTAGNVYLFSQCSLYFAPTYFDTTLLASYAPPSGQSYYTMSALLKLNTNGKVIWKTLPRTIWGANTTNRINPINYSSPYKSMMVLDRDTLTMIAIVDTYNIGGGGYYFLDFDANTGNLIQSTKIKSPIQGYGFSKYDDNTFIMGVRAVGTSTLYVIDSLLHQPHNSSLGLAAIITFTRKHFIDGQFLGDSADISYTSFVKNKKSFDVVCPAPLGATIIGNYRLTTRQPLGSGSSASPLVHFNDLHHFAWGICADTANAGGGFTCVTNDPLGNIYANLNFAEFVKLGSYTKNDGSQSIGNVIMKFSENSNIPQAVFPDIASVNSSVFNYTSLTANEKGEIVGTGDFNNMNIYAGADTALNTGTLTIKYGYPCSTDSALIEPVATDGLTATCAKDSIKITWNDNSNIEWGYKIYRSLTASGAYALIATTQPNATTYFDKAVMSSTNYWYKVAAYNNIDTGRMSNSDSSSLWCKSVGINDVRNNKFIGNIYPNPTQTGEFTLSVQSNEIGKAQLQISNYMGQIILDENVELNINNQWHWDLSKYSSGTYLVTLKTSSGNFVERVMVVK